MDQLWDQIVGDFDAFSYWQRGGMVPEQRQSGVLRINCIDCLDRTNVVQGYVARHHLEAVLRQAKALPTGGSLPADLPQVRCAWPCQLIRPAACLARCSGIVSACCMFCEARPCDRAQDSCRVHESCYVLEWLALSHLR